MFPAASVLLCALTLVAQDAAPNRVRVGGNVQAAKLTNKVTPVYPPLAKQARIQGTVRLTVIIARDGDVSNVQLISGHPLLVPSAVDAVKQWKYQPTLLNGNPVEVVTQVDVNFTLAPDFKWAVTWSFLSRFGVDHGELTKLNGAPGEVQLLADGQLRSRTLGVLPFQAKPLTLDGGEPLIASVFPAAGPAGSGNPEVMASWEAAQPRILSRRDPVKPRQDLSGIVWVDCVVDKDGKVAEVRNVRGVSELADAGREAMRDWRFRPLSVNGETFPYLAQIKLEF